MREHGDPSVVSQRRKPAEGRFNKRPFLFWPPASASIRDALGRRYSA